MDTFTNHKILEKCILFQNLSKNEMEAALLFFEARFMSYKKGELLSQIGSVLPAFGLVLSGTVQVYMDDYDGQPIIMANVSEGDTFGESLCFLEQEAMVYICASTDCEVFWLKTAGMKGIDSGKNDWDYKMTNRFIKLLSTRTLVMNDRIQILSKLSLREKLNTFFSQQMSRCSGSSFLVPFGRDDMAVYLGCNRSALSRELSKMKEEGILEFKGKKFTIHKV